MRVGIDSNQLYLGNVDHKGLRILLQVTYDAMKNFHYRKKATFLGFNNEIDSIEKLKEVSIDSEYIFTRIDKKPFNCLNEFTFFLNSKIGITQEDLKILLNKLTTIMLSASSKNKRIKNKLPNRIVFPKTEVTE